MIEPEVLTPYDLLRNRFSSSSGIFFACYTDTKYILYDDGECIFEIIGSPTEGYYFSNEGDLREIKDIFIFLDQIKTKYPDVADWFLFNIGRFS
jgi:hypothetical protein